MIFSSLLFLYIFLPVALLLFSVSKHIAYQNAILFCVSLLFYSWGGITYAIILLLSIVVNWGLGILIERTTKRKKQLLVVTIILNLLILFIYKYANFFVDNCNTLISICGKPPIIIKKIVLPIGISFYTFQGLSYVIDVYRGIVPAQKNFIKLGTYISMFPQLIAGPIVRYKEIQKQLDYRKLSWDNLYEGICRFTLGIARKVLIANQFALVVDKVFAQNPETLPAATAWIGILCYSIQIYYDFAGYSDMAIGLGKMLGFSFPENFNLPYIAKSIKDFWRRWHITLSAWFKDYLYIPLGGNRCSKKRLYLNLYVVFFCTGFWHGASWNFIVWGLLHGTFLVLERGKFGLLLEKCPSFLQHIYTLFVVVIAWVFFRAENLSFALEYIKSMFGLQSNTLSNPFLWEYATWSNYFILVIAIVCSTKIISRAKDTVTYCANTNQVVSVFFYVMIAIFIVFIIVTSTTYLVVGAYNPFIYFRF